MNLTVLFFAIWCIAYVYAEKTEQCMVMGVVRDRYFTDMGCNANDLENKHIMQYSNLTIYYKGGPTNNIFLSISAIGDDYFPIVFSAGVGHENNSPYFDGYYTFRDDAKYTVQDIACKLTKNDVVPSGIYKPTGLQPNSTGREYMQLGCRKVDVSQNSMNVINNMNIKLNTHYEPTYPTPCIYSDDGFYIYTFSIFNHTLIPECHATLCATLDDNLDMYTTTVTAVTDTVVTAATDTAVTTVTIVTTDSTTPIIENQNDTIFTFLSRFHIGMLSIMVLVAFCVVIYFYRRSHTNSLNKN